MTCSFCGVLHNALKSSGRPAVCLRPDTLFVSVAEALVAIAALLCRIHNHRKRNHHVLHSLIAMSSVRHTLVLCGNCTDV